MCAIVHNNQHLSVQDWMIRWILRFIGLMKEVDFLFHSVLEKKQRSLLDSVINPEIQSDLLVRIRI